jgi:hypothetical protein
MSRGRRVDRLGYSRDFHAALTIVNGRVRVRDGRMVDVDDARWTANARPRLLTAARHNRMDGRRLGRCTRTAFDMAIADTASRNVSRWLRIASRQRFRPFRRWPEAFVPAMVGTSAR